MPDSPAFSCGLISQLRLSLPWIFSSRLSPGKQDSLPSLTTSFAYEFTAQRLPETVRCFTFCSAVSRTSCLFIAPVNYHVRYVNQRKMWKERKSKELKFYSPWLECDWLYHQVRGSGRETMEKIGKKMINSSSHISLTDRSFDAKFNAQPGLQDERLVWSYQVLLDLAYVYNVMYIPAGLHYVYCKSLWIKSVC